MDYIMYGILWIMAYGLLTINYEKCSYPLLISMHLVDEYSLLMLILGWWMDIIGMSLYLDYIWYTNDIVYEIIYIIKNDMASLD